jgi:hypothetical protein
MTPSPPTDPPPSHLAWVLTEERPADGGGAHLVLTAVAGPHPRVRHRIDADGVLRAGLATGTLEESVSGGDGGVADVGGGERIELTAPMPRPVAPMPTPDGLAAVARLQRGAATVWESTEHDLEVRGVHDVEIDGATSLVLPLLRHVVRHITVTDDDRLLVLDEHAAQTRPAGPGADGDTGDPPGVGQGGAGVATVALALWQRPADVTSSTIRVHPRDAVRSAYVDGRWQVTATSGDERLVLSLPLDFPAERFGDA